MISLTDYIFETDGYMDDIIDDVIEYLNKELRSQYIAEKTRLGAIAIYPKGKKPSFKNLVCSISSKDYIDWGPNKNLQSKIEPIIKQAFEEVKMRTLKEYINESIKVHDYDMDSFGDDNNMLDDEKVQTYGDLAKKIANNFSQIASMKGDSLVADTLLGFRRKEELAMILNEWEIKNDDDIDLIKSVIYCLSFPEHKKDVDKGLDAWINYQQINFNQKLEQE